MYVQELHMFLHLPGKLLQSEWAHMEMNNYVDVHRFFSKCTVKAIFIIFK